MFNKFILFVLLGVNISAYAHQTETSTTLLVEKENNTWVLQISASLTAFQQEIKVHFAEYNTPEEFQQMVLKHVINNVDITFNENQTITLINGVVKLGHETKVVFEVFDVPSEIKSIHVKNNAFNDIYKSRSALVILKNGFNKEHFILNHKNKYELKLVVDGNSFVQELRNEASFFSFKMLFVLLSITILGLLYKMKTKKI